MYVSRRQNKNKNSEGSKGQFMLGGLVVSSSQLLSSQQPNEGPYEVTSCKLSFGRSIYKLAKLQQHRCWVHRLYHIRYG